MVLIKLLGMLLAASLATLPCASGSPMSVALTNFMSLSPRILGTGLLTVSSALPTQHGWSKLKMPLSMWSWCLSRLKPCSTLTLRLAANSSFKLKACLTACITSSTDGSTLRETICLLFSQMSFCLFSVLLGTVLLLKRSILFILKHWTNVLVQMAFHLLKSLLRLLDAVWQLSR